MSQDQSLRVGVRVPYLDTPSFMALKVRQRARCHNCGVKGNNTYQIVYTGNSGIAMDGAGVK